MEYDGIYGPTVKTGPYVRKAFAMEEKQPNDNPKKLNRKNPWGSRSYADMITQAIEASPEKRLTLSQIYEWMIRNIPFFSDQAESNSSAGWKGVVKPAGQCNAVRCLRGPEEDILSETNGKRVT
ncbi:Forkhead box protein O3 [Araneus ventricosus]|uniref:Forkhead box protein O3 n=1 Tax=Araneus ventricosus TaxID=182803 RepID=A0A4Y2ABK4_ARAVE|nr:Forkhead box protein O3 [Araneus ventricosus]